MLFGLYDVPVVVFSVDAYCGELIYLVKYLMSFSLEAE